MKRNRQDDLKVWAEKLVTQQNDVVLSAASKSERIEKRLAKKKRLDETKHKLRNKKKTLHSVPEVATCDAQEDQIATRPVKTNATSARKKIAYSPQQSREQFIEFSKKLERCLIMIKEKRNSWQKPYVPVSIVSNNPSKRRRQQLSNNSETWFQPRRSNYGGIGLARPSLLIALDDPSWQAKLEEEFLEHIPGFYGKQRTKAMKKQLDGQMLWRQLQKQKLTGQTTSKSQKNPNQFAISGKKLSNLNPDERVEAMIRAGYI
jgi:hypothetical protein